MYEIIDERAGNIVLKLLILFLATLFLLGCHSTKNKVQKGIENAICISKYDTDGCSICTRVGLTEKWNCQTGASCSSPESHTKNSGQCLRLCVERTDLQGCNFCRLSYIEGLWDFSCTEMACSAENQDTPNTCLKDMSIEEFKKSVREAVFDE